MVGNLSAVTVRVALSMGDSCRLREGRKAQRRSENHWWEVNPGVLGGARCRGVSAALGGDERGLIESVGGYLGHPTVGGGRGPSGGFAGGSGGGLGWCSWCGNLDGRGADGSAVLDPGRRE